MTNSSAISPIISHLYQTPEGQWVVQSNEEHCSGVAQLAARFASQFGFSSFGHVAGLLHDLGKGSREFQQYIMTSSGMTNGRSVGKVPHAYVGMLAAAKMYPSVMALILGSIIEAHHRGLYNWINEEIQNRRKQPFPAYIPLPAPMCKEDLEKELTAFKRNCKTSDIHLLIRMLFSCLVDADYLDTEAFMTQQNGMEIPSTPPPSLPELHRVLLAYLKELESNCAKSELNDIRHFIVEQCVKSADEPRGVFSLSVPTGGGKTLSSLVWALSHAIKNGMERVIVAIPYTSIIEQTAQILRGIFGEDAVLEHHSLMDMDECADEELRRRIGNWDAPIIVTTNVQLFESLFSHKPSKTRKLHRICNSVIILDEAQALPVNLLSPIVDSIDTLVRKFNCSLLISTATQPALGSCHTGTLPTVKLKGFETVKEIIPSNANLFQKMKRTSVEYLPQPLDYDAIAAEMMRHHKVLCVVNTRKDALEIFRRLPAEADSIFHLSKNMYPAHIKQQISRIKELLRSDSCRGLKVVSTQLIEAGVDIDFPVVMRQEAGLDSIIQAAGRCNREGKLESGKVKVFSIAGRPPLRGMMARANDARKSLTNQTDIHLPEVIEEYYTRLYSRCDSFDSIEVEGRQHRVAELLYQAPQFETVGGAFRLISDASSAVIVLCPENAHLIQQLKFGMPSKQLLRQLAPYSVAVHEHTLRKLLANGMVECCRNYFYILENPLFYGDAGIRFEEEIAEETFII